MSGSGGDFMVWGMRQFSLVAIIPGGHCPRGNFPRRQLSLQQIVWRGNIRRQLYGGGQFFVEAGLRCFYGLNAHIQILNRLTNYF